jgi:hypothetical protein
MENFEIWLSVDDEGNAAASLDGAVDSRTAVDSFGGAAVRTVKLTVSMELPEAAEIDVEVPAHADQEIDVAATCAGRDLEVAAA